MATKTFKPYTTTYDTHVENEREREREMTKTSEVNSDALTGDWFGTGSGGEDFLFHSHLCFSSIYGLPFRRSVKSVRHVYIEPVRAIRRDNHVHQEKRYYNNDKIINLMLYFPKIHIFPSTFKPNYFNTSLFLNIDFANDQPLRRLYS